MGSRKEKLIFAIVTVIYLCIFYLAYSWLWEQWVPWNPPLTDVLSIVVYVLVIVPISAMAGDFTVRKIWGKSGNDLSVDEEY